VLKLLGAGLFLVYKKQLSGLEKVLINDATLRFLKANQELAATNSASTTMRSTIYRANRKVGGG
jgi:hypothetical protein